MKKICCVVLILSMFIQTVFADEYSKIYDLIVPESYTTLIVNGGLGNVGGNSLQLNYSQNALEVSASTGSFDIDAKANAVYQLYNQTSVDELDLNANGNFQFGTVQNRVFASANGSYSSFDLDISGMPGYWYAGGSANVTTTFSTLSFNLMPEAGIGVGRTYSISNVYRAKKMMEHLGVSPTVEKVEAVVSVFQKSGEIFNKFNDDSTSLYKDYYQQLADAMGISDRALDVLILDTWGSQRYDYERAKFIGMISGWTGLISVNAEYNSSASSFSIDAVPRGAIGGFLMNDMLYYDANAQFRISYVLNSTASFNLSAQGRAVYLPDDYRWWAEAIANLGYSIGATSPFSFDLSAAGYYLINNNFRVYTGFRFDDTPGLYLFAGGEIRLW